MQIFEKSRDIVSTDTILAIDPGLRKSLGYSVCRAGEVLVYGVYDGKTLSEIELAERILDLYTTWNCKVVILESFVYFSSFPGGNEKSRIGLAANGATISKMKELISFIRGYLQHAGITAETVTSSVWKRALAGDKKTVALALKTLVSKSLGRKFVTTDNHWLDSIGLYLYYSGLAFNISTLELIRRITKEEKLAKHHADVAKRKQERKMATQLRQEAKRVENEKRKLERKQIRETKKLEKANKASKKN